MRQVCALLLALAPTTTARAADKGIFSDLDDQVVIDLPADLDPAALELVVDPAHDVRVLYQGDRPLKVYAGEAELDELTGAQVRELKKGATVRGGDRDDDGIPDVLDVLIGAKKVVLNGAAYVGGYVDIDYPGGDVPRTEGVCTDVVVRALRNAGLDLQQALHEDIKRAPKAYPMVKKRDANIDHRRVKTLLPWFQRHFQLVDESDAWQPGDVVFMDTFPSKKGPDHIGIVSDKNGDSGLPLVVNNWTDGSKESEMDLLGWVPVTHRFRWK